MVSHNISLATNQFHHVLSCAGNYFGHLKLEFFFFKFSDSGMNKTKLLTSSCGLPKAVSLMAVIPVPNVAPKIITEKKIVLLVLDEQ